MCGRYSLASPDVRRWLERYRVDETTRIEPHFNISPGSNVLAVTTGATGHPRAEALRWGLVPAWAKDPSVGQRMINARAETLAQRPAFRAAFKRFRCLIPADGFYEWAHGPGTGPKQPFQITRADHAIFAFAGLWSVWHRGKPDELRSATIITTQAGGTVAAIHDRVPVILTLAQEGAWLAPQSGASVLSELLRGLPAGELQLRPVSTAVNNIHNDGPECVAQPQAPAQDVLFRA